MKRVRFEKIKQRHANHASFAIWDVDDLTDTDVLQKYVNALHARVIIVGLNASGKCRPLGNFHGKYAGAIGRGNRDSWLRDAFNNPKTICFGAYMTDIFKHSTAVRQNNLKVSTRQEKLARAFFKKELREVGARRPKIIAIGKEAEARLRKWNYKPILIPHYAGRMRKIHWLRRVERICRNNFSY